MLRYIIHILLSLLFALLSACIAQPAQQSVTNTACPGNTSGYSVQGAKILDSGGVTFTPYGIQLEGILLAQTNWRTNGALTELTHDQVLAAHDFWHSNTVSLQLGSQNLLDQSPYDASYLATIDQAVTWTTQLNMNIILVLQYQGAGNSGQIMPTQDSVTFWNILAKHYASNSNVFFDVFNEPDASSLFNNNDSDQVWNFWQNGGTANGQTYVGFQQLVTTIRNTGAKNLIFADGLATGEDIRLLPHHTLSGCNIVYAVHPYLDDTQHHTPGDWDVWFGDTASLNRFPVVADEWSEYQSSRGECITDAATVVPQFLSYLKSHQIGLIGYALFPDTLIQGWNFRTPTTINPATYTCIDINSGGQGAGQLVQQYLAQNSVQN